jgi:hypothetical protein
MIGWAPGGYIYNGTPCVNTDSAPCTPVADADLDNYDFLRARVNAGIPASFHVRGEVFPIEYVGAAVAYTRMQYSTTFETTSGGDSYCATHFCDAMNFLNIDLQGRLPLLKKQGPLDILARVGYQAQEFVMFRRLVDPDDNVKKPFFDTVTLHGLRAGLGLRYTIIPQVRPHLDYNATFGLGASTGGNNFGLTGVTNHNFAVGVNVLPLAGLLIDVSYDMTTRALALQYPNEANILQRGRISEQAHTARISVGWAF